MFTISAVVKIGFLNYNYLSGYTHSFYVPTGLSYGSGWMIKA